MSRFFEKEPSPSENIYDGRNEECYEHGNENHQRDIRYRAKYPPTEPVRVHDLPTVTVAEPMSPHAYLDQVRLIAGREHRPVL